jgi:histidyl-tRNA synthetase
MSEALRAVRGMNDILPGASAAWERFESVVRDWLASYGYRNVRTPLLEHTSLFRRSIGEATDIVEKEMYSFVDELNGEHLTLRPEATASTVRAVIEHNLLYNGPQRLWYQGPMFRHEKPQKGRYRQFHQVGAEALGYPGPDIDAEQLVMCARLWKRLGIDRGVRLHLNSLGSSEERARHREALVGHFRANVDALDEDSRRRLETNPLRILDSKNPAMQPLVEAAPRLLDFLGDESMRHFEGVQSRLAAAGIEFTIDPRLVRGLDYYNLTVFEWVTDLLGSQGTVCGGGRYDGLIGQIGGKAAPAAGFAMGVERLLAVMEACDVPAASDAPHVYVVHQGDQASAMAPKVAEALRDAGLHVLMHCGGGGFKAQMRRADASGAIVAVIIGDDEAARGEVGVKTLREERPQASIGMAEMAGLVGSLVAATNNQGTGK